MALNWDNARKQALEIDNKYTSKSTTPSASGNTAFVPGVTKYTVAQNKVIPSDVDIVTLPDVTPANTAVQETPKESGGILNRISSAFQKANQAAGYGSGEGQLFEGMTLLPTSAEDAARSFAYGSERAAAGLLGTAENITDLIGAGFYKGIEGITSLGGLAPNAVSEWAKGGAEAFLDNSISRDYEQSIKERYNPSAGEENLTAIGQTVVNMLPAIGAAKAVSGTGQAINAANAISKGENVGRAIFGLQAAGGGANEARQEGATVGQALAYGAASGLLEATIESVSGGIPGLGKGRAGEIVEKVIQNPVVRRAADIAGEGGEEALSTAISPYIKRAIYDSDAEDATPEEIAQSAVMGMVAAGVLQAGIELPSYIESRARTRVQQPTVTQETTQQPVTLPTVETVQQDTAQPYTLPTMQPTTAQTVQEVQTPTATTEQAAQRRQGVQIPISERTWQDAGNRKVNAFQYDHPQLRQYYADAARAMKYDLESSVKGERFPLKDSEGYITGYTGTKRAVTEPIEQALDNAGLSYAQIQKALDDLIADNGQENYAAAKKVELVLDDMLTNGYTDSDGYEVPPNQEYIAARDGVLNNGDMPSMTEEEWASIMAQESGVTGLPMVNGPESSVGAARAGFDPYSAFLGTKSEFFPEGANAARPVDVPTTDAEGRNIRKTAATAMGAKAIPDDVVGDIQNMIMSGSLSYDRVTDKASIDRAVSKLSREGGFQRGMEEFTSAVKKGVVSKDLATLGQQLLVNAANAGDANATAELLTLYAQMETTAGQAVQAASILRKLSPTAQLYAAQKAVDRLNDTIKKPKRNISKEDNVPVEIWMQRIGENLADSLAARVKAPKETVKTVSETILSDLRKFSSQTAPKRQTGKSKRTEIDRITDLFQNKDAYNEAWQAAKDTLSDTFENEPDALAAFDEWLDSSLDYSKMLTKELTGQTELRISENLVEEFLRQTDQEGRNIVLDKIYHNIADQVPSTWKDKWNAWRYLAMLANPRTHFRNIFGNIGFQPVRFMKDRLAAVIESGVSAASGGKLQRTKSFVYDPKLYAAAWKDYENVADVLSGNKYDDVQSIINDKRKIFGKGPVTKSIEKITGKTLPYGILEGLRRGNTNLLSAEDVVVKRFTYADALSGYLNANGVTAEQFKSGNVDPNLLSAARDYAGKEALKATYQDRNDISDAVARLGTYRGDNKAAKALSVAVDAVLPFKRTPANIFVRGLEYSPIGLTKGLTYDLYKVSRGEMSGAQAIDNIASGLTGTGLMALGAVLAAAGVVTGGAGDDEKQAEWNELTGGQTYALNLPNGTSVTLDWLAPEALPFFMGVQAMQSFGEEGLTGDSITSAFASLSEPMLEMSMLQSLNDLIDNVSYAASNEKLQGLVGSALISYLTQAIPTIGGQIERTGESKRYSTYTDKDSLLPTDVQYALGKAAAKIPGVDYQQVPFIDAWGREETTGTLPMRAFNNFLNPSYTSSLNVTPVDAEVQRLYNQTGIGSVIPSRADRSITVDGETVNLSGDQYVQYATAKGQTAFDLLSSIIESSGYQSLSDQEKADVVADVYEYANSVGKAAVSSYKPDGITKKIQDTGVDPADYILYLATADADGNSSITQGESAVALLPMKNLTTAEKGKVWQSQNSSWSTEKNPFTGALANAGISPETAVEIMQKYSDIQDKEPNMGSYTKDQKQRNTELSQYLDGLGLTSEQREVVDGAFTFGAFFNPGVNPYSIETMSDSAQKKWPKAEAWGMSEEDYLKFYPMVSSGKKADCLQALQNAGMTEAQANYFWDIVKKD